MSDQSKDRGDPTPHRPNQRPDQDAGQKNAEEIKNEAAKQANEAARVKKPFP